MDQFVVDLGDGEAVPRIGDEAVLFGPGSEGEPTVADWAGWASTIPHEIISGVGPRVARRYVETEESPHV
jgi:alanine racemase